MKNYKVITPLFPTYAQVKAMMKAVSGYSLKAVRNMITAIHEQTGTPQKPVDWSEPDLWISERLTGEDADIARRIWDTDNHILNPRHSYGCYLFLNYPQFELMESTPDDTWQPTSRGQKFLQDDEKRCVHWTTRKAFCNCLSCWLAGKRRAAPIYCRNGRPFASAFEIRVSKFSEKHALLPSL